MEFIIMGNRLIIHDGTAEICFKDIHEVLMEHEVSEIELPMSVRSIGDHAFFDYPGINRISIPEGVRHIGTQAFWGLDDLEKLEIPVTVQTIGKHAFCNCVKLKLIIIGSCEDIPSGWDPEFAANINEIVFTRSV